MEHEEEITLELTGDLIANFLLQNLLSYRNYKAFEEWHFLQALMTGQCWGCCLVLFACPLLMALCIRKETYLKSPLLFRLLEDLVACISTAGLHFVPKTSVDRSSRTYLVLSVNNILRLAYVLQPINMVFQWIVTIWGLAYVSSLLWTRIKGLLYVS